MRAFCAIIGLISNYTPVCITIKIKKQSRKDELNQQSLHRGQGVCKSLFVETVIHVSKQSET